MSSQYNIINLLNYSQSQLDILMPGTKVNSLADAIHLNSFAIRLSKCSHAEDISDAIFKISRRMINLYQQKQAHKI